MREAQGLGLGLSIVDRIARVLRLEIQLESHKGRGTRLSVILPRVDATNLELKQETRATHRPGAMLDGVSVICIDNDARILDGMRLLLEGWGCVVVTASGSSDLPAAEPGWRPDIVLVDYHLDNEDGLGAIAALRNLYGSHLPAVLVTADRSNEVRAAAAQLDVTVINKPVKPANLRNVLNRCRKMLSAAE